MVRVLVGQRESGGLAAIAGRWGLELFEMATEWGIGSDVVMVKRGRGGLAIMGGLIKSCQWIAIRC